MFYFSLKVDDIHLGCFKVIAKPFLRFNLNSDLALGRGNPNFVCNTPSFYAFYFCEFASVVLSSVRVKFEDRIIPLTLL